MLSCLPNVDHVIKSGKGPIVGFNTAHLLGVLYICGENKCIDFQYNTYTEATNSDKVYTGNSHVKTDPYRGLRL